MFHYLHRNQHQSNIHPLGRRTAIARSKAALVLFGEVGVGRAVGEAEPGSTQGLHGINDGR